MGTRPTLRERVVGLGGGASIAPLIVLFGLNAVDELDRSAFGLLQPEIRDYFGLSNLGVTLLSTAILPAVFILGIPIARYADRARRTPVVIAGAMAWGVFSVLTGLAPMIVLLALARIGAGIGRAVNDPVHSSLLSDYYPPSARAKVFGFHRAANTVGALFGPIIAGLIVENIASRNGWRYPFLALAIPTFVFIFFAFRYLREPERTGNRFNEAHLPFRQAFSMLWSVGTLRRIWMAFPFIAFVSIGMGQIMSLYYEDIFNVGAGMRGFIQAADAPFILLGLLIGTPLIDKGMTKDPGRVMKIIGLAVIGIAVMVVGIAVAPTLWFAVACSWAISTLGTVLYAGGFAIISLVAPPDARASAYAFFNIASLIGIVSLPMVGIFGDTIGFRWGLAALAPIMIIGSFIIASAGQFVNQDIERVNPNRETDPAMMPPVMPPSPPAPLD